MFEINFILIDTSTIVASQLIVYLYLLFYLEHHYL